MRVHYRYNASRNRSEIILIDEDYEKVITVDVATDLSIGISHAIAMAFYDFTESAPNTDAPVQQKRTQDTTR